MKRPHGAMPITGYEIWVEDHRDSLHATFVCANIDDLNAVGQHKCVMHLAEQWNRAPVAARKEHSNMASMRSLQRPGG